MKSSFVQQHLDEAARILRRLDVGAIEKMVRQLVALRRRGGRLFLLGVGDGGGEPAEKTPSEVLLGASMELREVVD